MIFLLANFALSSIYALDIGTQNVRIALGVPGKPIEILTNDQSSRSTPNYLAFGLDSNESDLASSEWVIGSDAERIVHRNSSHGIANPFFYLTNPGQNPLKGVHPSMYCAIAFSLHLRKFKKKHDKLIIAVPSVFTPQARHAIIQSLKLINIQSAQILDSNNAIASLYAVERLKKAENDENLTQKILFFDIGAVQTEASLWNFTRIGGITKIELLDYRYSDEIGGDIIDRLLFDHVIKQLPREPTRAELGNIHRAMKKGKERLASGSDQFIDLYEDFNTRLTLTNSEIDELAKDTLEKLRELIKGIDMPDEIELIGGCSRLPSIVNVIQDTFPNYTLKRSLNSDEAVAVGAAYYASLQTGTIAGSRLEFSKPSIYGLDFIIGDKKYELYQTGDIDDRKSISMRKFNDFNFSVKVSKSNDSPKLHIKSKLLDSAPEEFTHNVISGLTNLTRSITKQLANGTRPFVRFIFGHSQVLDCLDYISSSLTANISVNVTIEGKTNFVDSTPSNWGINTETKLSHPSFLYDEIECDEFIGSYLDAAQERKAHAEASHKIEGFIIDLTDKIEYDSDFQTVTTEEERNQIMEILSREREALELSSSRVSSSDLKKRLEKLKERLKDELFRFSEYKNRPSSIAKLNKTIVRAEAALANATTDNETLQEFIEFLNETKNIVRDAEEQNPLVTPTLTVKYINERHSILLRKIPGLKAQHSKRHIESSTKTETVHKKVTHKENLNEQTTDVKEDKDQNGFVLLNENDQKKEENSDDSMKNNEL